MKMLGVGAVVGPGVLAGGSGIAVDGPGVYRKDTRTIGNNDNMDSTIMAIRIAMAEKMSLPGPVMAQPNMTANQLEIRVRRMCFEAGMPADCVLGGYPVHWNPSKVNLKEI